MKNLIDLIDAIETIAAAAHQVMPAWFWLTLIFLGAVAGVAAVMADSSARRTRMGLKGAAYFAVGVSGLADTPVALEALAKLVLALNAVALAVAAVSLLAAAVVMVRVSSLRRQQKLRPRVESLAA